MSQHAIDDDVDDLPPSAKYVLNVVEREGPIRRQELLAETALPERTLDDALDRLNSRDFLSVTRDTRDLRQVVAEMATE
jgi:DNA-binding MarR family transcriptional regulator